MARRPIGIDLFAGAGGMSLGFEQAGFDVRAAVEIDPIHCAVHEFNFTECTMIPDSVANLSAAEIRTRAGLEHEEIDVVFGGPPCQGFSLIGKRSLEDPRNQLVLDFVRIVAELDAKFFVFENVKGLTVGAHKQFLSEIVRAFDEAGYDVRLPWHVLNAADYGVPQHRERLILVGCKKGLELPEYPAPTCVPADDIRSGYDLPIGPTVKDALADIPNADDFEELWERDHVTLASWSEPSAYARQLRCEAPTGWLFGHRRNWNPLELTSSIRTSHTEISRRRFSETVPGSVEPISRFLKLPPYGLSNTLRAGTDHARGAFTSPRPIHYEHARCVTVREMARLHGFPDWFRLHSTKWHGARQIGNAVAPPLARAIGLEIMRSLGVSPKKSNRIIKLGDHKLLNMEMSEAAEYYGVVRPSGKRTTKSGIRKRKQIEIEEIRLAGLLN